MATRTAKRGPARKPRTKAEAPLSAFAAMSLETLTIEEDGRLVEMSLAEMLDYKTFEEALAGKVSSVRAVFKMLAKREAARSKKAPTHPVITSIREHNDSRNAEPAMLLLEILEVDPYLSRYHPNRLCSCIQTWAAQAAITRLRKPLSSQDVNNIRRRTANSDDLEGLPEGR